MNQRNSRSRKNKIFADLTPLKASKPFARMWIGGAISQVGAHMTTVAVGMHVYDLTGSTFKVSLVALWAIGPMIIAGLFGGTIADAFDRRIVSLVSASVSWITIAILAGLTFLNLANTLTLYILAAINAAAATIMWTTKSAIMPRLLPPNLLPAASALHGIGFGTAVTVGPALAGVIASTAGFGVTYLVDTVLFSAGFFGILTLPKIKPGEGSARPGFKSVIAGLSYLKNSPNIRATFIYDLVAMVFGQPRVVFPAVGMLLLGGGYTTAGILTAAVAFGALGSSLFSGWLGSVQKQGRAVTYAIMGYGLSVLVFGVTLIIAQLLGEKSAPEPRYLLIVVAAFALALSGATDNVSAIFRSTILQVAAPDNMRGRLQGISTVVVTGGPRFGDLLAGMLAATVALWAPAVIGGMAIFVIMLVLARVGKNFMSYDSTDPKP